MRNLRESPAGVLWVEARPADLIRDEVAVVLAQIAMLPAWTKEQANGYRRLKEAGMPWRSEAANAVVTGRAALGSSEVPNPGRWHRMAV